ncbi:hypothetical protein Plec18167_008185 [Paecilomyces lecythidis]|uniref:Cytochrome P450 n=1 Tax=Paecilomyces lecythidis TaxID=3004212 RepID=A0ABR3WZ22_9EURO
MASKLAFDVVGRVALDIRLDVQNRPNPFYQTLLQSISLLIVDASPRTLWKKTLNIRRPFILWNNNRKIRNYLSPIINSHLQTGEHNKGTKTVTGLAIEAYPKLNAVTSKEVDPNWIDILVAQLKIFFIAGTDTTAATICFMYELLHSNPDKLKELRAEHDELLGDKDTLSATILANPNLLNQLPYTSAVIKETLRLFPPVGSVREGSKDFFLINPETGARLPTDGWMMFSCSMAEQRHEAFFPRPHDFVPERWFASESEELYVRKNTFRPFELGPRNCIGQELVQMELRIILALTIRELDIVPMLPKDGPKLFGQISYQRTFMDELAASPKEGMPITVKSYDDGHSS